MTLMASVRPPGARCAAPEQMLAASGASTPFARVQLTSAGREDSPRAVRSHARQISPGPAGAQALRSLRQTSRHSREAVLRKPFTQSSCCSVSNPPSSCFRRPLNLQRAFAP